MNKDEILDALEDVRENFLEAIDGLSDEAMQEPGVVGDWSIKDIMIHISTWEAELIKLLWQAKQGQQPTTVHFRPINVDECNQEWIEAYHNRPLERVLTDFAAVRKQTSRRVDTFTDNELTAPGYFSWSNGHPLWKWIADDSFGHEEEHISQIKEWLSRRSFETSSSK